MFTITSSIYGCNFFLRCNVFKTILLIYSIENRTVATSRWSNLDHHEDLRHIIDNFLWGYYWDIFFQIKPQLFKLANKQSLDPRLTLEIFFDTWTKAQRIPLNWMRMLKNFFFYICVLKFFDVKYIHKNKIKLCWLYFFCLTVNFTFWV